MHGQPVSKGPVSSIRGLVEESEMMDICGFWRWYTIDWFWKAAPRTEQLDLWRDNVIYVDFRAIREAKEQACERR